MGGAVVGFDTGTVVCACEPDEAPPAPQDVRAATTNAAEAARSTRWMHVRFTGTMESSLLDSRGAVIGVVTDLAGIRPQDAPPRRGVVAPAISQSVDDCVAYVGIVSLAPEPTRARGGWTGTRPHRTPRDDVVPPVGAALRRGWTSASVVRNGVRDHVLDRRDAVTEQGCLDRAPEVLGQLR